MYQYQVDGVTYQGDVISFYEDTFSSRYRDIAESIARKYSVGKRVTVYYLPKEPELCALEPLNKDYVSFIGTIAFFLVGIGFVVVAVREDLRLQNKAKKLHTRAKTPHSQRR
jgi:hypothetical protein